MLLILSALGRLTGEAIMDSQVKTVGTMPFVTGERLTEQGPPDLAILS